MLRLRIKFQRPVPYAISSFHGRVMQNHVVTTWTDSESPLCIYITRRKKHFYCKESTVKWCSRSCRGQLLRPCIEFEVEKSNFRSLIVEIIWLWCISGLSQGWADGEILVVTDLYIDILSPCGKLFFGHRFDVCMMRIVCFIRCV